MPNEIYQFLKANKLTDKSEADFLKEYSSREKADEIHQFMVANKLTDKTSDEFYTTYLKKKESSSGQQGGSPSPSSGTKTASVPEKAPPASIARPQSKAPQASYAETVVGKAVNLGAQPQEPANKAASQPSGAMSQQTAQSGANAKIVSRPTNPLEAVVQQKEQVKEQVKAATPSLSPEKQYEANQSYNKNVDDQLRAAQYKLDQNKQKGAYAGLNHEMRLKYSPEYRADLQEIERLQALKKEWDAKSKESIDKVKPVIEKDVQAIFKDDAWMKTLVTESVAGAGTTVKKADTNAIMAKAIEMAKAKGLEPDSYYRKLLQNEIEGYVAYKIKEPEYEKVFNEKFVSEFKVMPDEFIKDVAQGYSLEYEKKIGAEKEIAKNKQDAIAKSLDQEYAPIRLQAETTYKQAIDALSQAAQNDPEIISKVEQYQNQVVAKLQSDINAGRMTPEEANAYLQGEEFNKEVNGVFQNLVAEKYDKMYDDAYKLYSDEISQVNKKMNQRYVRESKEVLAMSQSKIDNLIKEYDETISKLDVPPHIKHAMERIWMDAVSVVNERDGAAQNAKEQGFGAFGKMYRSFVTTLGSNFKNMGYKWGAESLESLGSTMESAYTYQPEEIKDWSDLLDLSKMAGATGSLGGSMLPTMLPAMAVTFGTMGAGGGVGLAMLTGAATSFLSESEMMAAQVYNDKLIETGSAAQAEKAKREMWKGQVDMMWAYTFDMLPFVNVLSKVMPSGTLGKVGQVVAGAVIEPTTETIQEYMQQANEMSISTYGDISKADEFKTKERVKKVFLEVAPTGILGGGGQALQLAGEARDQAYINKRLAELNVSSTIARTLGENGYKQHVFTMIQDMGVDKTLLALNNMYQEGMIDKATLDMGLKAIDIGQQSISEAQSVGIKTENGQKIYNNYTLEIENLKQAWAAAETQTAKEVIEAKIEEKQKQQKAFAVSGKSDAVTVIMMDGQQFVTDVNGFVEMMQNPEFAQAYKEGKVASHFNDQLLLNEAREKLSGIDAGIATNIKDFKPVNATAQEVQDVADALIVGGYDKLNQYQKRVFADNRQSILAYTSLPSRFIRMTKGSKGYGAEVSNIANKIFLEGKESLNADEISIYNKERQTIDSAVEQLGKQEAKLAPQQTSVTAKVQQPSQMPAPAQTQAMLAEPIVKTETIADAMGAPVIYRGKKGTVEFMTDGTVEFTDEQGNVQVVPDATGNSDLKSAGIRKAPAVEMQALDEQTMIVDGNEYTIETDAKGNVTQLTPVDPKLPAYSTEDMLVEVEIARNRVITDAGVNAALDADPISVETAVAEVGIAAGVDTSGLAAILDNNMTPEVDAAMTKLETGGTLTADERALFDDYILNSVAQLEQAKQNNPAIAPVVDNLINQLYEYDKSIEAAAGKPAVAKPAEAKVEPVVQKPAERVEAAGKQEAKQEVAAAPSAVDKGQVSGEAKAKPDTKSEPAKKPEISQEKPQAVSKPAEKEKTVEKPSKKGEKPKIITNPLLADEDATNEGLLFSKNKEGLAYIIGLDQADSGSIAKAYHEIKQKEDAQQTDREKTFVKAVEQELSDVDSIYEKLINEAQGDVKRLRDVQLKNEPAQVRFERVNVSEKYVQVKLDIPGQLSHTTWLNVSLAQAMKVAALVKLGNNDKAIEYLRKLPEIEKEIQSLIRANKTFYERDILDRIEQLKGKRDAYNASKKALEAEGGIDTDKVAEKKSERGEPAKAKSYKPKSEKELATALKDVFGLTDKKAEVSAKIMASAAKGMIAAGIFKNEAEFWDSFPEIRLGAEGFVTQQQFQENKGVYIPGTIAGKFASFIAALGRPDVTTPHHEGAHWWYDMLNIAAGNGNTKAKTIMDAFNKFANSAEGRRFRKRYSARGENVEMQELWARSYEKFLHEGKAPKGLEEVFEMISQWFKDIYGMIAGKQIDIVLSDAMRGVYSYILTGDDIILSDITKVSEKEAIEAVGESVNDFKEAADAVQQIVSQMPEPDALFQPIGGYGQPLSQELDDIKAEAQQAGTFMKAPNGKPSNLNERQWLQVRTAAFKDWFGDWENDPANASKVVDENGEPMVVYHGSRSMVDFAFSEFNVPADGVFFTSDYKTAIWFSQGRMYNKLFFEEVKIPDSLNEKSSLKDLEKYYKENIDPTARIEEVIINDENRTLSYRFNEDYDNQSSPLGSDINEAQKKLYNIILRSIKHINESYSYPFYEVFLNIRNPHKINAKGNPFYKTPFDGKEYSAASISAEIKNRGENDGLIIKNTIEGTGDYFQRKSDTYIAFSSNQIKSAIENVGTFSPDTDNILFQSLGDKRDNKHFRLADLIYPDVVFGDISTDREGQIAIDFYQKIVRVFNKKFGRDLKVIVNKKGKDFEVAVQYETGLQPKYFAYPTRTMGEHEVVDNLTKTVPLTSLRHELLHEALVKHITDKFERINNMDNSAEAASIEEVQRGRAYNYTLEDVFFERVVENIERLPDNKDTFSVDTFGVDVINRLKEELGSNSSSRKAVLAKMEDLLEDSNPWLTKTLMDIFSGDDINLSDLESNKDVVGKKFKQKFDVSKDIFTKELQTDIYEFTEIFNDEYLGVLTRLDKQAKRNKAARNQAPAGNRLFSDPLEDATRIANEYSKKSGIPFTEPAKITKVNEERAKRIAKAYDKGVDSPNNKDVAEAYKAMIQETLDQYDTILESGYKLEVNNTEPYSSSSEMIADLRDNKRMKIFSTESGFGAEGISEKQRAENPLLAETKYKDVNGNKLLANDIFRFVHDFFGHAKLGNGFGAVGEENAWNVHSRMYSPLARKAMTTETRGQNSWVNFSGVNDEAFKLRDKARELRKQGKFDEASELISQVYDMMKFADQKIFLLPDEFVQTDDEISYGQPLFQELEDIKAEAQQAGTFMKAPNGKPSNLNERQWLQVRTSAFKNWFGDWENDPKNASKVVDENGEPMVVYHGTDKKFEEFSVGTFGSGVNRYNDISEGGFYFTDNKENAQYYSGGKKGDVLSVFLNIKNPLVEDVSDEYSNQYFSSVIDYANLYGNDGVFFGNVEEINIETENQYVVFSPNQIKSATDNTGAFSSETGNILFQDDITDTYYEPHMTETADGNNFVFFHVSSAKPESIAAGIDSTKYYSTRTSREEKGLQYGVASYYTKPTDGERMVGGKKYTVVVPKDKVYPMDADPKGYRKIAQDEVSEDTPFRASKIASKVAEMAKADGYEMAVGEWNYDRVTGQGRNDLPAMRADALVPFKPQDNVEYQQIGWKNIPHPEQAEIERKRRLKELLDKAWGRATNFKYPEYHLAQQHAISRTIPTKEEFDMIYNWMSDNLKPEADALRAEFYGNEPLFQDPLSSVEATAKVLEGVDVNDLEKHIGVVYHGTNSDFTEFDENKIGATDDGWYGKGFYFHTDKNRGGYGNIVKSAIVILKNPLKLPTENAGRYLYDIIGKASGLDISFRDKSPIAIIREIGSDRFTDISKKLGYDGVEINYSEGTKEIVSFDKNNIKIIDKKAISEAYHKAKADGSNPELVKAVEELIAGKQGQFLFQEPEISDSERAEFEAYIRTLEGVALTERTPRAISNWFNALVVSDNRTIMKMTEKAKPTLLVQAAEQYNLPMPKGRTVFLSAMSAVRREASRQNKEYLQKLANGEILFQPSIEPIKQRIEQYAQVALNKYPDMTKQEFLDALNKNKSAKEAVSFLGEDVVGMIFDSVQKPAAAESIFDTITAARYGEAAGLSVSDRAYINRALDSADTEEYYEELQKLGNKTDEMSFTAIEPIAQQIFDKMLESESPEAAFLSFLESSRMNTPSIPTTMEKGKGLFNIKDTLYNVRSIAAAQVFHKIIAYYHARRDYATAAQWTDVFSERGRLAGQFTSAMQAVSTPEAIANRMLEEDAEEKESVLDKPTKTGKKVKEVFKEVEDASKTKKEEAERLLNTGKSTGGAKKHINRKKKVGNKKIEIKATSADSEKKKKARESLNKKKPSLKEKLKLGGYLLQEPKSLIDDLRDVIGDIVDMGAISREQALETFVKELASMGVKANKAKELFNQAWDTKFEKPIEANLTAHLAEKIANLAKPKKVSKKRSVDPIELLANGLMARAADILPKVSTKGYGKAYEGLAELIRNRALAQKAWTDALELLKVNVNGNPELTPEQRSEIIAQAEDIASNFLNDPLPKSKVRQAIRDGMKDLGITIDELITKSLTEQNNTGQTLAQILVEQAGLTASEAVLLADAVIADWNEMFADAKRKQVEQILEREGIDPDEKAARKEERERTAKAKEGKSPLERAKIDLFNAEERLLETEMKLEEAQQNLDRADADLEAAKQSGDRNRINTATRVQADAKMKHHRLNNQFEQDLETAEKAEKVLAERQAVADKREAEAVERDRRREQAELDRETARIERQEEAERRKEQREREAEEKRVEREQKKAETSAQKQAKEAQRKQEREDEKKLMESLDTDGRLAYRKEKAQSQLEQVQEDIRQAATEMQAAVDANDAAEQTGDPKKIAEAQKGLNKARKRVDQLSAREMKIAARIENLSDLMAKRRQAAIDNAEAALQRMVSPKAKSATGASMIQKIMNAASAGVFNRSDLLSAFASAYGLTPLTPAQVSYLQMLTAKLINSRGIEMRERRARELANFMEAMSKYQLLKAYKFAGDLMYAKMLSGINTVMMNIPVGSMTGLYSEVIPKALTSPMAYFGFLNAYRQLDGAPFYMPGTGMKTFADAIKTGFNMLEDLSRIEKPYQSRGSYFEFVFQKGREMMKSDSYAQRVKGAILSAASKFKFFMNFTVAWDAMFNHRYGEMALFIDTWNAEKNAGIKGYANLLEATKKKLGLDDPAVAAAKQEVAQIEAAEKAMGEQLPIGHSERELKWQVMRNRSMEAVEKSYDAIKGAALMGKPTGISGKFFEKWMQGFQYREGNTFSDNAVNTFKFIMNNSVNLFLRIGIKSFNRILLYSPGIGLFTGVFAEYKPVTEVVNGKRTTSWEMKFNDRGTIISRLLVQAAMGAAAAALFASMFKYDDDEEEWVLDPDRVIDMTLSRGAITGNMSAEKLEKGYQALSIRYRKSNGEWSAWTTAKYAPMFIGVAAVLGGMRDRVYYLKSDGSNYGSPSKRGVVARAVKDVDTALEQLTFNQNLRLIQNMIDGIFKGSEYKREMFWRDLLKPVKTMLPFGSNFERDVINTGLDIVGVPMKRGTSAENIFLGGHVMFDAFAENAKTDRWGNVIPKTAATESLATRMTAGYYTDKGLENLRQFVGYKLIDKYPEMFVPETWTTRSHARYNDEFEAYHDKYKIDENAMIELDAYIAEKWGSELRAMYPDRKDRIKSAEQATDLMKDSRDRAVRLVKSGTINGIRNMPARRLYEDNKPLWRKVFPELAKKHKL